MVAATETFVIDTVSAMRPAVTVRPITADIFNALVGQLKRINRSARSRPAFVADNEARIRWAGGPHWWDNGGGGW